MKRPSTEKTYTDAEGNAAANASRTNATPSRFVRNACDSSAVIVTAWVAPADPVTPKSAASSRSSGINSEGARCSSNGRP